MIITGDHPMSTYVFRVELQQEADGRWSVWVPAVAGCASWGSTRDDALRNIQEALQSHLEAMVADGDPIPDPRPGEVEVLAAPAVAVNL